MALVHYDIRLRHRQRDVSGLDPFSRHFDLEDPEQRATIDRVLTGLLVDAVRRAGENLNELWAFDLQLYRHGKSGVEFTFVASASEVPEELR